MNLQPVGTLGTRFEVVTAGQAGQTVNITIELPLPGEHNVLDALAALSVGLLFEVSLQEACRGLAEMELSRMRLELHPGIQGSTLISDVYNANPTSMQASLKVLQERGGNTTLAILGDMYELGDASISGHFSVGKTAAELGISELIAVGELAGEIARGAQESGMPPSTVYSCLTREEAVDKAREILGRLNQKAWVLIKASRGMRMEEVTKALREG
jgi:UDP-N-acetylmuramoyl-tripeptide--D-alanyl-D-alanine ligase